MSKTGGGTGTNQYRIQGYGVQVPLIVPAALMQLIDSPRPVRCGELWGTKCRAMVGAPTWGHGAHPDYQSLINKLKDPDCPQWVLAQALRRGFGRDAPRTESAQRQATINPGLQSDIIRAYLDGPAPEAQIVGLLLQHPSAPPDIIAHHYAAGDPTIDSY